MDGLNLLRELVLDQNRVKNLSEKWFSSHTHLIELSLNDNRLRSLTHLQLTHLQRLHLNNNKLQVMHSHKQTPEGTHEEATSNVGCVLCTCACRSLYIFID